MRGLRAFAPVVVFTTLLGLSAPPASAARTSVTYAVSGAEVHATSTRGVFVGTAVRSGATGGWYAAVGHTPLGTQAKITGGSFRMLLTSGTPGRTVTGRFRGGSITQVNPGEGCTRQVFSVLGRLMTVSAGVTGPGRVKIRLTHYRTSFLGRCRTYAATVKGSLTLAR
jgi:hypothetical protein